MMKKLYFIFAVLLLSACREEISIYPHSYVFDKIRSEKSIVLTLNHTGSSYSFNDITKSWSIFKRDSFDFLIKKHLDNLLKDKAHIDSFTFNSAGELSLNTLNEVKILKYSNSYQNIFVGEIPNTEYIFQSNNDNGLSLLATTMTFYDKVKKEWFPIITNYSEDLDLSELRRAAKLHNLSQGDTLIVNLSSFGYKFKK